MCSNHHISRSNEPLSYQASIPFSISLQTGYTACSTAKCSHHSFPCMLVASTGMKPSMPIPMLPIPWLSAPPKVAVAHHRHVYPHIPGHNVASLGTWQLLPGILRTPHKYSTAWWTAFQTMVCACAMVVNGLGVCVRYVVTG